MKSALCTRMIPPTLQLGIHYPFADTLLHLHPCLCTLLSQTVFVNALPQSVLSNLIYFVLAPITAVSARLTDWRTEIPGVFHGIFVCSPSLAVVGGFGLGVCGIVELWWGSFIREEGL